jgi:outer membrane autotransporter protein
MWIAGISTACQQCVDNDGIEDYDSSASAISLETGYRYDTALQNGNTVSLTPQAQATWQHYSADSLTDHSGTRIDDQDSNSWNTRLGLRVDGKLHNSKGSVIQPFMEPTGCTPAMTPACRSTT